jgi:uncharacterized membrane protein YoaK (UPF0700 family)
MKMLASETVQSSFPSADRADSALLELWLPPSLSVIAGAVDVIGLLNFKLFTAHVTGNIVVIATLLVRGGPPNLAQVLAIPAFIVGVAATWLAARAFKRRGAALARPLLIVQFALLSCALVFNVVYDPATNPQRITAVVAAMMAVFAMACQFALLRLAVPGTPSTAVMTGNLTNAVLSLLDSLFSSAPLKEAARERLDKTVKLLAGFFAGCVVGAAAVSLMGTWSWSLPVILAAAVLAIPQPADRQEKEPA